MSLIHFVVENFSLTVKSEPPFDHSLSFEAKYNAVQSVASIPMTNDVSSLALPCMLRCWSGSSGEAPLESVLSVCDGCLRCAGSHHN